MGHAPIGVEVSGQFIEADHKGWFEYSDDPKVLTDFDLRNDCNYRVFCGHGEDRPARILKTVAHVMVDEGVWETWKIRHIW